MKILFLAPEPFFETRGTPIAIWNLAKVLCGSGHQVDLVTYHLGEKVQLENLRLLRIPNIFFIKKVPIGPSYRKLFLDKFLFLKAFFLCLKNKYDVIHGVEEGAYLGAILSKIFRKPLVYDMDSNIPDQLKYSGFRAIPFLKGLIDWFDRFTINRSAAIISVCSDLSRRVVEKYPNKKLFQIEDLPLFEETQPETTKIADLKKKFGLGEGPVLLYTGNFEQYQGVELLVEAARKLATEGAAATWVLVGGEEKQIERLKVLFRAAALEKNFIFTGKKPLEEIPLFLALADVLISPRLKGTNVPMKIYSYLYSGKPIVATKILAHTQVLDEKTAVLVEPEPDSLFQGILTVLKSPALARDLGIAARRLAEQNFNRKIYQAKVKEAYHYLEGIQV